MISILYAQVVAGLSLIKPDEVAASVVEDGADIRSDTKLSKVMIQMFGE